MRKIIRSLLVLITGVFLITTINVKAESLLVESIDGASIRTQGVQGLRFYAKLDESVKANVHAFYLVYGKTTVQELETVINDSLPMLNGKEVFKVVVPGVTDTNEFSVVLTDIPEVGYFDELSSIAYVEDEANNKVFVEAPVRRSVATVALKMINSGLDISGIESIHTITNTSKKKVAINAFGNLEVSSSLYEHNHFNLKEEFLKDWNIKFNLNLLDLDALNFYNSAIVGITNPNNLAGSNLYEFFNDVNYKDKWGWLLDFLNESDALNESPASIQIAAVKADGTSGIELLESGIHLSYSITNFFNQEALYLDSITFNNSNDYNNLNNNKIYVDLSNYDLYDVGESIIVPEAQEKLGYNFLYYKVRESQVFPGQYILTTDDVVFEPRYQKNDLMIYEIYTGGGNSGATYNSKYVILYNPKNVDVDLNGYSLQYATAEETSLFSYQVLLSRIISANTYYSIKLNSGTIGEPLPIVIDLEGNLNPSATGGKLALVNGVDQVNGLEDENIVDYVAYGTGLPFLGNGAALKTENNTESIKRVLLVNTKDNKDDFESQLINLDYLPQAQKQIVSFKSNGGTIVDDVEIITGYPINLPAVTKEGFLFDGWFETENFAGEPWDFLTPVTNNITLYAKWVILPSVETTVMAQVVIAGNPANMLEGTNYATHAGLAPDLFTVNGLKGDGNLGVGLYAGAFRLYSVRASGNGNTLKISIAAGYEITNIKINYATSGAATTADLDLGGTVQNISALKDESQDYNDLAISYFSIKNTHQGGSTNLQIHLGSIEITFKDKDGPSEPTDQEKVILDLADLSLPEQVIEAGTFNLPTEGSRGSTITWTVASGDSPLIDLLTGIFIMPETTENLVLKATVSFGVASAEKTFTILFHVTPQIVEQTIVEDFTNSTATASYTNGSFIGVNGVTWAYVESRNGDNDSNGSGINLPALMLRRSSDNSSVTSSAISGGISSFSVKLYKGFTGAGNRQVELYINGISYGTSTAFDDFNEHIFTVNDINIVGDIIIEVKNITSKQVIIDDITWTTYSGATNPNELLSIQAVVRTTSNGSFIQTKGIITTSVLNGNTYYAFMQDNFNGIYIESTVELIVGNEVIIKGVKQTINGAVTLVDINEVVVEATKAFNIAIINLNELNNYLGKFVQVTGYLTKETTSIQTEYELATLEGIVKVQLPSYIEKTYLQSLLNGKEAGLKIKLEGYVYKEDIIYLTSNEGLYIEDVVDNVAVSEIILAGLDLPLVNEELLEDITLPVTDTKFNSTIEWLSSNQGVLSNTGKVSLPDNDTTVSLYYEIKIGSRIIKESTITLIVSAMPLLLPYYQTVEGKTGDDLFIGLRSIISNRTLTSYEYAKVILENSDRDPNNYNNVLLIYNRASVQGPWSNGGTIWNREHVWPSSLLGNAEYAEAHNLRPANPSINSSRGNKNFADGSGTYGAVTGGWYPGDEDRGDVARIMFYMITLYSELTITTMGSMEMFIQWHYLDPVDDFERNRNEVIYSYTNNRNPYIDNPQFVSMIWEVTTYSSETEEYIYQTVEVYMVENVYFERRKHFN